MSTTDVKISPMPKTATKRRLGTRRKADIVEQVDRLVSQREQWIARYRFYYDEDWRYLRFLVALGRRVLDLGCGTGELLHLLQPSHGVGVDFSQTTITRARALYPGMTFIRADVEHLEEAPALDGKFDTIILSDTIGLLDDCLETLRGLHRYCEPHTRIVISYHSRMWEPLIALHAWLTAKRPVMPQNWLSTQDIANLLDLADFDVVKCEWRLLCPFRLFGLGRLINRFVATLPMIRKLCLRNYVVARPRVRDRCDGLAVTVVVPCRNERGNIEAVVQRIPQLCPRIEIIFVEGGSTDGTWEEIQRVKAAHPHLYIRAVQQLGTGKGDAVRQGFAAAKGDLLMILDADLTLPPEDLPKFYEVLISGKGEFVNGSRLVYPTDRLAMQFLNLLANYVFARLFTYLLNQRYTDTLCGTKALPRLSYDEISRNRAYFGEFDPFGDFDLIFGAAKLSLKTAEVPIRYGARKYGQTQISRFRHGWLLLRMVCVAFLKLKAL